MICSDTQHAVRLGLLGGSYASFMLHACTYGLQVLNSNFRATA